jgi:uncharacterized protein YjiS (DUF1127 family)
MGNPVQAKQPEQSSGFPRRQWSHAFEIVAESIRSAKSWMRRRQTAAIMAELDDHIVRDIGASELHRKPRFKHGHASINGPVNLGGDWS